jgi:hypothetical protein
MLDRTIEAPLRQDLARKMVLLSGPRQCGKTLVREILDHVRRTAQPPPNGDLPSGATLKDKVLLRLLGTPGSSADRHANRRSQYGSRCRTSSHARCSLGGDDMVGRARQGRSNRGCSLWAVH